MVFARGGVVAGGRQKTARNDHSKTTANHIADGRFTTGAFTPVLCSSGGDALCRPNGMIRPFLPAGAGCHPLLAIPAGSTGTSRALGVAMR